MPSYIPLNVHSHYSLLNALPKIPDLVAHAKKSGIPALALTDDGNLYGAIEFYKECKKAGVKPILGMHPYLALRGRSDRQPQVDNRRHRLLLLVKNEAGYRNLIRLTTAAHLEGFYYRPRIDRALLEQYSEGLIAIAPAFNSDIFALAAQKDERALDERIAWYKKQFGEHGFFLELSRHPEIPGHNERMDTIIALSERASVPLVASQEIYYLAPEDKRARETMRLVSNPGDGGNRAAPEGDFSFLPPEEMARRFADFPDALRMSERIGDLCSLDLTLGKWIFPAYETGNGKTADEELRALAESGIARRHIAETDALRSRIEYELAIIKGKGYAPYFLVVGDLIRFAHEQGILTTIRGSVAGSLVTYLAGITNVDPLPYRLPF